MMKQLTLSNCRGFYFMFISIKEDMLFCRLPKTTCKAEDVLKVVSTFIASIAYVFHLFILLLPQTAALPGSDAGSDVIKPASSFVIQNRQKIVMSSLMML